MPTPVNNSPHYVELSREFSTVWVTPTGIEITEPIAIAPATSPVPSIKIEVCKSVKMINSVGEELTLDFSIPNKGEVYASKDSNMIPVGYNSAHNVKLAISAATL